MPDHQDLVARSTAVERVLDARAQALGGRITEAVALDAVGGRTLAELVVAEADAPPHAHATMDGYAVDVDDGYPLEVVGGEVFPEDEPPTLTPGTAVPIATGAPVPAGATAVLKREDVTVGDGHLTGPEVAAGTYVYERGSNLEAGETLFEPGERLGPKDAVLLRDLGYEAVEAYERFSVGVLATGTEIHEGRSADLDSPMLGGLVEAWGAEATFEGTVPDERATVEDRIAELAGRYDVVVTTGGTSVGHKDHVVASLRALGEVRFHGVRVRPGKPIALADLPDHDATAFAIPGKPVGAHVIATTVMRPFFTGEADLPGLPATLARTVGIEIEGFEYAVPVTLDDGEAMPFGHVDSPLRVYDEVFDASVLSSSTRATRADGLVFIEATTREGETVHVVPHHALE